MTSVRIIGCPLDFGASRRGTDMGPSALRIARLAESLCDMRLGVEDVGDVAVPQRVTLPSDPSGRGFLATIAAVCADLAVRTAQAVRDGVVPLSIGGDHSLVAGSFAGVARAHAAHGQRVGCIYLDAHGDLHTPESSLTGNVHGMPLAHLLGHGDREFASIAELRSPALDAKHLVLVGIRDLDEPERQHIREWGITCFTMTDIDKQGLGAVMEQAIAIASRGTIGFHVSCDMDWIDPDDAPGVGTPVRGGATYREAHLAMEMIAESGRMTSLDMVEVNPVLDDRNRTAELAVQLAKSAFGHRII